ncbi:MAG: hypothetical protein RLZZ387_439 [Chloroflexota bacterium]|jgi:uncharacterized protein YkwD
MRTLPRLLIAVAAVLVLAGTAAAQTIFDALTPRSYMPMVRGNAVNPIDVIPPTTTPFPTASPTPPDHSIGNGCYFPATDTWDNEACEIEVIRLINVERAKAGCPAAVRDPRLTIGARNWSTYMRVNGIYQHSPIDWYERPENGGFDSTAVGENLSGASSPENVVNGWMASTVHRNLILSCESSLHPGFPGYDPNAVYEIGIGFLHGFATMAMEGQ